MQPDDGRDVGVNPLVAGLGGIATVGFVAARDVLDAASGAAAGASAVAREVTRSLPKLARLGQLQAHTQVSLGKLLAEQAAGTRTASCSSTRTACTPRRRSTSASTAWSAA